LPDNVLGFGFNNIEPCFVVDFFYSDQVKATDFEQLSLPKGFAGKRQASK
jgi:hypothetical protein